MFQKIDLSAWERKEHYEHFMNRLRCNYSITANVDITTLLPFLRKNGIRFYPAMIYLLSAAVNRRSEFRMAVDADGALGYFDVCHPSYTVLNEQTKTFSGIWTGYDTDFSVFYQNYLQDIAAYSASTKYAPKENQPENTFYVSCLPWLSFTSLTVQLHDDGACLTPRFTIGKYFEDRGKFLLPLSAELHHAVCDGYHASQFFNEVCALADAPDTFLR